METTSDRGFLLRKLTSIKERNWGTPAVNRGVTTLFSTKVDDVTLNSWHPLTAIDDLERLGRIQTKLLGQPLIVERDSSGRISVAGNDPSSGSNKTLPQLEQYGFVWTTFGDDPKELFKLPEYHESDRKNVNAGTFGVRISAPRAVENFLDMAHFAFVHSGYLGEEPNTEIKEYSVEFDADHDEIISNDCLSIRTQRSDGQPEPVELTYVYRIMQPNLTLLTMPSVVDDARQDIVALFVQPVDETIINAHMLISVVDNKNDESAIRRFQQIIFGQDKPILENQLPKLMPLDPLAETPIRADKLGVAYRRWLRNKNITYGTIPAPTS